MKRITQMLMGLIVVTGIAAGGIVLVQHNDWLRSLVGGKTSLAKKAERYCLEKTAGRPALEKACKDRPARMGRK